MLVKIISIMLANTYTTDDLVERIALMRIYFGKRLFSGASELTVTEVLLGTCSEHTLATLERWMEQFRAAALSPLVVYEALDSIEEDIAGLPALTFYVPVRFDDASIERFGTWFRENVEPNLLLTLRIDPKVVGGCAFIWRDVYHDYSLRYYIDRENAEVFSMFDRYLHAK
jgi:hypothetical protein